MIRKFLLLLSMIVSGEIANAQTNYAASDIPKNLMIRSNAVIRTHNETVEVKSYTQVIYHVKKAITVFNNNGDVHAAIDIYYTRNREARINLKGVIYNEFGMPVSKFSDKNLTDESAISDGSLYEDSRVKRFKPAIASYPYTIEYEYEQTFNQSLLLPYWKPIETTGVSVQSARFELKTFPGFSYRLKELNYAGKAISDSTKDFKSTVWTMHDAPSYRSELYSPHPETFLTSVRITPDKFSYQGVDGSFANWKEFGTWVNEKLLKGRTELPPETIASIKELVSQLPDEKSKAKKIYEYMQQKSRYISVQIGIGGFQPAKAFEVDKLSYGDCKALVNYTQALLNVAGIKSYYCIVQAGSFKRNAPADFATMQFGNHIILCLPFERDTTWLECTSKDIPFGFLSDFTDDRTVIACTESGGKIMHTPYYSPLKNKQIRKANFRIDSLGNADVTMETSFSGTQYENHDALLRLTQTEMIKKFREFYEINNIESAKISFTQNKSANPTAVETAEFTAYNYGVINGGRLYIPLNEVNSSRTINELRNRTFPVYINRGYTDVDELTFKLPGDYKIESLPENKVIKQPFGEFSVTIKKDEKSVTYTRSLILKEGNYPAEAYQQLVDFYQEIKEADNSKLVLIKR
ncbi:DUF3857 domain-containing protein [Pedobacter sp. HMF7647]|uniref:DUF3857 domain-containing protein n=1 Tax=Hufsiella arboris TaxID=2695275 RepID=A0A7K1YBX0_9SPHI|nr:DUF3857 domain-containing protein [Hufsiella arboris]MXV52087.1 DUF3857 domain-containing protein [Hufsiella arboris]